jgi:hypothetical protein
MVKRADIQWTRLFAEGGAIVVSILLAFWIDAWWDGIQRRDDERVVLQAILEDLAQKKAFLERADRSAQARIDSATELIRVGNGEIQGLSSEKIDELMELTTWYSVTGDWNSAPITALIEGGELSLITNNTLVELIASFRISLDLMREYASATELFAIDQMYPFLFDNANLLQMGLTTETHPGSGELVGLPKFRISNPVNHADLLSTRFFQNLLYRKLEIENRYFRNLAILNFKEQMNEMIDLVESELAK